MYRNIRPLETEAMENGEAYRIIAAGEDLVLGLAARWESASLHLELEGRVRLLSPRSPVDPPEVRAKVDTLIRLKEQGFGLFHYDDGWVVASKPVSRAEVSAATERAIEVLKA